LNDFGYQMPKDRVPISPAFHYSVGGIKSDLEGKVPGIQRLYVIGEAACTGVHGANRLASNSLLEGLVFAVKVANNIVQTPTSGCSESFVIGDDVLELSSDKEKKDLLRKIMWEKVSIVRTTSGLNSALDTVNMMLDEPVGRLLLLRLLSAKCIIESALKRTESIGVHYIVQEGNTK
jgi:L-aspartate oxidase